MRCSSAFAVLFLLVGSLHAEVSFITEAEYSSQLYHSPRGIGCHKCHGEKGEGKLIASYRDKGVKKTFHPSAIDQIEYAGFAKAMTNRQKGMPKYFLTTQEIETLYFYLHKDEKKDAN